MRYFQTTTDASDLYRPSAALGGTPQATTVVSGNLSDVMRNSTIFRVTFVSPVTYHVNNPIQTAADTYGTL